MRISVNKLLNVKWLSLLIDYSVYSVITIGLALFHFWKEIHIHVCCVFVVLKLIYFFQIYPYAKILRPFRNSIPIALCNNVDNFLECPRSTFRMSTEKLSRWTIHICRFGKKIVPSLRDMARRRNVYSRSENLWRLYVQRAYGSFDYVKFLYY